MGTDSNHKKELYNFFQNLDRSLFIDNEMKKYANLDEALSIGHGQTISQPTLVYGMTEKSDLSKEVRVLEIGTGSGYQTAFLAQFAGEVYTVERIESLSVKAKERLTRLGYDNIHFKIGNGNEGWEEFAPFDRILVTAGASDIPKPLLSQLKNGGRMIIPVGKKGLQQLLLVKKDDEGNISKEDLGKVIFVELVGEYGWKN